MIEIDFNDLLDNYDKRLLDDLRGFGKGKIILNSMFRHVTFEKFYEFM